MAGLPWLKVYSDLPRDPRSLILGDILGDPRAWTYVVQFRMYLADKAPVGRLSGQFAPAAFERCAGWAGEKGALLQAMRDAGFVRVGPARDGEGTEIEDLDWAREQGAHVAKVERDAKKPRGNSHTVVSPSRDIGGTEAGPSPVPRGESRELRVENKEEDLFAGSADAAPEESESPKDLQALWNSEADPRLPRWRDMTEKRAKAARARLREHPLAQWRIILGRINASPFCLGVNERRWKADVEFLLRPDTATKVLEGKYDPKPGQALPPSPLASGDWVDA